MDNEQAWQLADEIDVTPGYESLRIASFRTGFAILVHEHKTGWERWIHSTDSWERVKQEGFAEI